MSHCNLNVSLLSEACCAVKLGCACECLTQEDATRLPNVSFIVVTWVIDNQPRELWHHHLARSGIFESELSHSMWHAEQGQAAVSHVATSQPMCFCTGKDDLVAAVSHVATF